MPVQNEDSNNTFIVPPEEWAEAKQYFHINPGKVKFKRKRSGDDTEQQNSYSFIQNKADGKIYAMANKQVFGHSLGKGVYGNVKMVQTEQGQKLAVKIEGRGARAEDDAEKIIMN